MPEMNAKMEDRKGKKNSEIETRRLRTETRKARWRKEQHNLPERGREA